MARGREARREIGEAPLPEDICEMLIKDYSLAADYATEKGETALMKALAFARGHQMAQHSRRYIIDVI